MFTFGSRNEFVNFSESDWNKLIIFGGGAGGKRNGSGEPDGTNLVRMGSILSSKKSRNVVAREDASGDSGN